MSPRLFLLTVAAALTTAWLITSAEADGPPAAQTLQLVARSTGGGEVDNAPKGVSVGDEFFEHGTVADTSGRPVGRFTLTTQLVAGTAEHGTEHSTTVLSTPHGEIVTLGAHATVSRFATAVVGGTGRYAGARGTITVAPGPRRTERVTIELEG